MDEPVETLSPTSRRQNKDGPMLLHNALPHTVKVLLVEDNSVQTLIVKAALAGLPHLELLAVAKDGVEAVAFLKNRLQSDQGPLPDVILLDLNMPNKNGFEVLSELKSSSVLRRIPVVVFSTSGNQGDVDRAYEEGANSYVVKPPKLDDLKQSLELIAAYWAKAARLPTHVPVTEHV